MKLKATMMKQETCINKDSNLTLLNHEVYLGATGKGPKIMAPYYKTKHGNDYAEVLEFKRFDGKVKAQFVGIKGWVEVEGKRIERKKQ